MVYNDVDILKKVGKLVNRLGRVPTRDEIDSEPGIKSSQIRARCKGGTLAAAQKAQKAGYCDKDVMLCYKQELGAAGDIKQQIETIKSGGSSEAMRASYASLLAQLQKEKQKTALITELDRACIEALKPPKFKSIKIKKGGDEETALLCLGDVHVYELIQLCETMGKNEYTPSLMRDRIEHIGPVVAEVVNLERKSKPVNNLVIFLLGDIVTGENIYKGQPFYVNGPAIYQARLGAMLIAQLINTLSKEFKSIRVETTPGNHGRVAPKGMAHYMSNWDDVLYDQIEQQLKNNKRVTINKHDEVVAHTEIMGRKIAFSHGHDLAGSSAKLDTLMERAAKDWPDLLGYNVDMCVFGHVHTPAYRKVGNCDVFVNGSVCGANHFASARIRKNTPPSQWLIGIHPNRVTWTYQIDFRGLETIESSGKMIKK